jgi:hypothetical protein
MSVPPRPGVVAERGGAPLKQRELDDEQDRQHGDDRAHLLVAAGGDLDGGVGDEAEGDAVGDREGER